MRNTILNDAHEYEQKPEHEYEQKLELGKVIFEIVINDDEIDLDSLRPVYKEALDLYTLTTS